LQRRIRQPVRTLPRQKPNSWYASSAYCTGSIAFPSQGAQRKAEKMLRNKGDGLEHQYRVMGSARSRTEEQVGRKRQDFGSSGEMAAL